MRFMLERAKNVPLNMYVMASSCVPATDMETAGAAWKRRIWRRWWIIRGCSAWPN